MYYRFEKIKLISNGYVVLDIQSKECRRHEIPDPGIFVQNSKMIGRLNRHFSEDIDPKNLIEDVYTTVNNS